MNSLFPRTKVLGVEVLREYALFFESVLSFWLNSWIKQEARAEGLLLHGLVNFDLKKKAIPYRTNSLFLFASIASRIKSRMVNDHKDEPP